MQGIVADECQSRSFLPERIFVLPQGELGRQLGEVYRLGRIVPCIEVAALREVLPGRQDLPKSVNAPKCRDLLSGIAFKTGNNQTQFVCPTFNERNSPEISSAYPNPKRQF